MVMVCICANWHWLSNCLGGLISRRCCTPKAKHTDTDKDTGMKLQAWKKQRRREKRAHIMIIILALILMPYSTLLYYTILHCTILPGPQNAASRPASAGSSAAQSVLSTCCGFLRVSVKKHSSGEEDMWENQFSEHQIGGRATGLHGQGSHKSSVFCVFRKRRHFNLETKRLWQESLWHTREPVNCCLLSFRRRSATSILAAIQNWLTCARSLRRSFKTDSPKSPPKQAQKNNPQTCYRP